MAYELNDQNQVLVQLMVIFYCLTLPTTSCATVQQRAHSPILMQNVVMYGVAIQIAQNAKHRSYATLFISGWKQCKRRPAARWRWLQLFLPQLAALQLWVYACVSKADKTNGTKMSEHPGIVHPVPVPFQVGRKCLGLVARCSYACAQTHTHAPACPGYAWHIHSPSICNQSMPLGGRK